MTENPYKLSLVRNDTDKSVYNMMLPAGTVVDGPKIEEKTLVDTVVKYFKSLTLSEICDDGFTAFPGDAILLNGTEVAQITPEDFDHPLPPLLIEIEEYPSQVKH